MPRGAFITLEGTEGVGKSSCLTIIGDFVESSGHDAVLTREPGGTPLGEGLRDWMLDGDHGALSAEVEALLMFAARALHINAVVEPALAAGRWVICDRFTDATMAYQGGGRGADRAFLESLAAVVQGSLLPDLTLLLDAPVDVGLARISGRAHDHFEREGRIFFERVRSTYLDLARREPERIKVVDASAPLNQVKRRIVAEIEAFEQSFGARHGR
jgi:dTMP kinase